MKYKLTIVVEGGAELDHDMENGYIENGICTDVFPNDKVLEFSGEIVKE